MAIKNRRGIYSKFDPSKLLPGEWAVVLSGDPNAADGRACYMCFESGEVKRMATYDDMVDNIAASAGDAVAAEIDKQCKEAIADCQEATTNAKSATNAASEATTQASNAASKASTAASNADTATKSANAATTAAQKVIQGDLSANTVTFTAASSRTAPATGESLGTLFGKVAKWLSDLKAAAFCAVANNLTTTASGSVLDARQGKTLSDKLGTTDISAIGDGTVTGAISTANADAKKYYKWYKSVGDIGLDVSTVTWDDILNALPDLSSLKFAAWKETYPNLDMPSSSISSKLIITVDGATIGYVAMSIWDIQNNVYYYRTHNGTNYTTWKSI